MPRFRLVSFIFFILVYHSLSHFVSSFLFNFLNAIAAAAAAAAAADDDDDDDDDDGRTTIPK